MNAIQPSGKVDRKSSTSPLPFPACGTCARDENRRCRKMRSSIDRVLKYKNDEVVARIQKDLKKQRREISLAEAQAIFLEMLMYLWGTQNGGSATPSAKADDGWHAFLMFTMDYRKFCLKYFGRFIHHKPAATGACSNCSDDTKCYSCTSN